MAKDKKLKEKNCRLGTVGGEAVLEGVMMKGKEGLMGVAVRKEDGSIVVTKEKTTSIRKKHKILNIPIVRGVVGMIESFILSYKVLNISAEVYGLDESEEPSKFEKWLDKTFGKNLMDVVMSVALVLGVVLAMGLFFFLPIIITKAIEVMVVGGGELFGFFGDFFAKELSFGEAWNLFVASWKNFADLLDKGELAGLGSWKSVIEGLLKIVIFIAYLSLVSLMKDIRRTFQYHGAEHKSIFCYESGEDLTVENVKKFKRFHPRCGTSFIFVILLISIAIFSLPFIPWNNPWLRFAIKLPLMPLVIGLGFEFIMFAGKHDNIVTRILSAPGLLMQRITTREPDDQQIEVAITALKTALPEDFPDFVPPTEENLKKAKEEEEKAKEDNKETENDEQGV
ncbi:MAG: DUF1385 domain-containing protein [Clostridia bacterium]|nr:DUF1385 domain-containing protein [Clostridia bacterium]